MEEVVSMIQRILLCSWIALLPFQALNALGAGDDDSGYRCQKDGALTSSMTHTQVYKFKSLKSCFESLKTADHGYVCINGDAYAANTGRVYAPAKGMSQETCQFYMTSMYIPYGGDASKPKGTREPASQPPVKKTLHCSAEKDDLSVIDCDGVLYHKDKK